MGYSTNEVIDKLKKEDNIDITARTINYYAYDKKMFPDLQKGKNSFSDREVELIKRIVHLKNRTSLSLHEIKEWIQDDYKYLTTTSDIVNSAISEGMTRSVNASSHTFSTSASTALNGQSDVSFCNYCNSSSSICSDLTSETYSDTSTYYGDFNDYDFNKTVPNKQINFPSVQPSITPLIISQPFVPNCTEENKSTNQDKTVKINSEITITVSDKISKEQLIDIINYINSKTKWERNNALWNLI